MRKIAVLLLAHREISQVIMFINQFDERYYDIYIHMDKKYQDVLEFKKKNVYYIPDNERIDVRWGQMSMIDAMLLLLKKSAKGNYSYYWYVSGQDLLIRKSTDIYFDLLKENKNLINFMDNKNTSKNQFGSKLKYKEYYSSRKIGIRIYRNILFRLVNMYCKFKKTRFVYGSQWSILKHDFVEYIQQEDVLSKYYDFFKNTLIPDESFFQTIILESPYKKDYKDHSLYIDWSRGGNNPKILTENDLVDIFKSQKNIARKFDIKTEENIILKIKEKIG